MTFVWLFVTVPNWAKFVTIKFAVVSWLPVMVPALKLPEASRWTIVFGVLVLVAALAAVTPLATLAADCPPTVETTVAFWVPVTSPASDPEKLFAVVALVALVAVVALVALPARLPLNVPLN